MSNNLSAFTCQICNKILHKPFILPCSVCSKSGGSNICQEHLGEIFPNDAKKEAAFECKKCKTKLNLIKADLKENSQLNLDLQRHVYLSDDKRELILTLDAKLDEIEKYLVNLRDVKVKEYLVKIYDHFYVLRNDVDIKRETVLTKFHQNNNVEEIEEINELSTNLIQQLDLTENEFRKGLMQEIESNIKGEVNIEEFKRRLNDKLRDISLREKDLEVLKIECESKLNQTQGNAIQIDKIFCERLKANKFREYNGVSSGTTKKGNLSRS